MARKRSIPFIQLLFLVLNQLTQHVETLPSVTVKSLKRDARGLNLSESSADKAEGNNCSSYTNRYEDCPEDLSQMSPKVIHCLDNCANCVRQWVTGVYNGRDCANDCLRYNNESLDPDCNLVKYLNSKVLTSV